MRKAKELSYTGENITAVEAQEMGMINYAWPKNELEDRTIAFADRIAVMSSDHLAALKVNMNRFYENMGIYSSVRSSTDHDAMGQFTDFAYQWRDQLQDIFGLGCNPFLQPNRTTPTVTSFVFESDFDHLEIAFWRTAFGT